MNKKNQALPVDRTGPEDQGTMTMVPIAVIRSDFHQKFGIPRQSGLVPQLRSELVFLPPFRQMRALKGLEQFSHVWLIWQFSEALRDTWTPQVRPPRLGGDTYMGVFATRSPFRPNPLGLSCVKLEQIREDAAQGPVLTLLGADLMDGTPIYDIKPYLPYADSIPDARGGFTDQVARECLEVLDPDNLLCLLPEEKRAGARGMLSQDPRPAYQHDPERIYGVSFAGFDIRFGVRDRALRVIAVTPIN